MRKSARGFTLVELLVVISIIAILSVIGITVFSGVQKQARDAKRRGDVTSIAQAFEQKYNALTGKYALISPSGFASGQVPADPTSNCSSPSVPCNKCNGNYCFYCIRRNNSVSGAVCNPAVHQIIDESQLNPGSSNYIDFTSAEGVSKWEICANLESGGPTYCVNSSQ